jgi:diguanylate cyclase (GGDEF)-like protein
MADISTANQHDVSAGNHTRMDEIEKLTERCQRAEAALAALEQRNRVLGDSAPFGIMAVDLSGRIDGLNGRMRDLLPWPQDVDPVGTRIYDFPALVEAGIGSDFRKCMQTNQTLIREYACINHEGMCLQLRFYISPVSDGGNSAQGVIAFVENYTTVKMAETAAAQSEHRYRILFQSAPIAMLERDASELKTHLEALHQSGILDLKSYFKTQPEEIGRCLSMIKTVDCNDAFIQLLEARDKEELMEDLPRLVMGKGFLPTAEEILLTLSQGRLPPEREMNLETLRGHRKRVIIRVMVLAGHEDTLARIVVSLIDITKRMEAEEALRASEQRFREQSLRDNLTGLFNQRYLYHSLPQLLQAAQAYHTPVSLIFMDLDNFKKVVDANGHLNGSRVIQEVAGTIKAALAAPCYAVSYAGDEFVVVLPDFDEHQAMQKARDLQALIGGTVYLRGRDQAVQVQISCGIATFPTHADDAESLLMAADTALFHIKGKEKGSIALYSETKQGTYGRSLTFFTSFDPLEKEK